MIRVKDIEFSYTLVPFIQGVSFEVSAGEIFGFLGPSGAGKSTLQKILTGVLTTYGGSVIVNGVEVSKRTSGFTGTLGLTLNFRVFTRGLPPPRICVSLGRYTARSCCQLRIC